jgi:hypothetical protein
MKCRWRKPWNLLFVLKVTPFADTGKSFKFTLNHYVMPGDSLNININNKGVAANTFEAIVIGSGISGGWAAKELCEHGVKTLLLERGRNVVHKKDYPTALKGPWEFTHRGKLPLAIEKENPVVSKCYAFDETAQHFFVKDKEHPYVQEKPFDWIRGYQVGNVGKGDAALEQV